MATATVTSKGQITVPISVRQSLRLHAGDRIEFIEVGKGKFEIVAASEDITQLKGMVKTKNVVSIEEMDRAIKMKSNI